MLFDSLIFSLQTSKVVDACGIWFVVVFGAAQLHFSSQVVFFILVFQSTQKL